MQAKYIITKVEQYVAPIIAENNFELVSTEFIKENNMYYLRLFIDKEGGFSINDCELVSRYLEAKLEKDDFIKQAYILEVSSPGIDRILKKDSEFIKYKGRIVDVKLFKAIDKVKVFQGELIGLLNDNIIININGKQFKFNKKDVATCRLAVVF